MRQTLGSSSSPAQARRAGCGSPRRGLSSAALHRPAHPPASAADAAGASRQHAPGPVLELAARASGKAVTSASVAQQPAALPPSGVAAAAAAASSFAGPLTAATLLAAAAAAKLALDRPSRPYAPGSVGREYDAWTREGILEYYWGEHIHLGYYTDEARRGVGRKSIFRLTASSLCRLVQERARGYKKKNFKQAKLDFTDRMLAFAGAPSSLEAVLDVGCGIGGTTRHLARTFGAATRLTGITLSPNQAERATALASKAGLTNVKFEVMDALAMDFPDNTFDLVWACESGEHMPDKKKYVEEMTRVLKPGGTLVIATWCQRDAPPALTPQETEELRFLYEEWSHPYFISIEEYGRLMSGTGAFESVHEEDWAKYTIPAWRHSVWAGVWDPWPVVARPGLWVKTVRDIYCLERMHRAFAKGLMKYGMLRGVKKAAGAGEAAALSVKSLPPITSLLPTA